MLPAGGRAHDDAVGIDQAAPGAEQNESYGSALGDRYGDAVRQQAHHAGGFDPRNLFQLFSPLVQWNKEDVAADIGAGNLHHLHAGSVMHPGDLDAVAGFDAEAGRTYSV